MGTNALNQRLSRVFKDQGIHDQSNSRRTSIRSHSLNTALLPDWHWLLLGVLPLKIDKKFFERYVGFHIHQIASFNCNYF